jgi:hypothetical protein
METYLETARRVMKRQANRPPVPPEHDVACALSPQAKPTAPLQGGWRVTYRDARGSLREGCVVETCGASIYSRVTLESGEQIAARQITAVTEVRGGKDIAAWEVRRFGLDGQREETTPVKRH